MTHTLKTIQPYYDDVLKGVKNFELRKMDRPFNEGDVIILQEFVDGSLTGREQKLIIDYILSDCPQYGLMEGYGILGFKDCPIEY